MNYTLLIDAYSNQRVAVFKDGKLIKENQSNLPHSDTFMQLIDQTLNQSKISVSQLTEIVLNIGPGSFTGIRICSVIARTAAQQAHNKVVGVSSLEILSKISTSNKNSLVLLDARKNKVYTAIYSSNGVEIKAPYSVNFDDLQELISSDNFEIISDNSIHEKLREIGIDTINYEQNTYPLGNYLYEIVNNKLSNYANDYHWAKVKPLYIQPPSITIPKEKVVQNVL